MNKALKIFTVALLAFVLFVPLGCGAGYEELTQEQKAQIAFNILDVAFDTAEAVFVLLERDGVEHMPTARAAYTIVKSAIETYLENLRILGIIETPAYAVEAIDTINDRAVELGVVDRE